MALRLQLAHQVFLVLWLHPTTVMADAGLLSPEGGCLLTVAAHHVYLNPHLAESLYGFAGMRLERLTFLHGQLVGFGEVDGGVGDGECPRLVYHHGVDALDALQGSSVLDENVGIFFDSTCTMRLHGPQNISKTNVGFFVRYDATSGNYINYGVVPAIEGNSSASPGPVLAVINNRVFALSLYKQFSWDPAIIQWSNEGNFICHIPFSTGQSELGTVNANQKGTLLVDMVAFSPVTFSNNVVADCNNQPNSHAVFALYHNPEFSTPYVGITNYGERLSDLRIWPNPANNFLNIVSDNNSIDYITIMDLNGKILMRKNVGNNIAILNVSLLPAGTYLLETVGKGEISVKKFVKHNMY